MNSGPTLRFDEITRIEGVAVSEIMRWVAPCVFDEVCRTGMNNSNSNIDESAIRHVAQLARLKVSDEEVARYAMQLSRILEYVRQLDALNTDDVPPTAHAATISNVFREDDIQSCWSQDQALANAPQKHGAFFKLPKVLEQEES